MKQLFRSTILFLSFAVAGLMAQAALPSTQAADTAVSAAQAKHHHKKHHRKHGHRKHVAKATSAVEQSATRS